MIGIVALAAGVAGGVTLPLTLQAQPPTVPVTQAEFEVASVKPNTSLASNISLNRTAGGGLSCSNVPLRMLITFAYDIRDYQLSRGPAWIDTERYDITARLEHEAAAAEPAGYSEPAMDRLRLRLRSLLADRFKLTLHHETREMPVYVLMVAKNGPHLDESKTEFGPQIIGRMGILTCKKMNMKGFAEKVLSERLGCTVLDKTGIAGEFDFKVEYAEEGRPRAGGDAPIAAPNDITRPTFVTAFQEQLGLKLESQKGPVEFIIIDHAERASAN